MQPTARALFACGRRCQHLGLRLSLRPVSNFSTVRRQRFCRRCRKKLNWYGGQFDRHEIVNIHKYKKQKTKKKSEKSIKKRNEKIDAQKPTYLKSEQMAFFLNLHTHFSLFFCALVFTISWSLPFYLFVLLCH